MGDPKEYWRPHSETYNTYKRIIFQMGSLYYFQKEPIKPIKTNILIELKVFLKVKDILPMNTDAFLPYFE